VKVSLLIATFGAATVAAILLTPLVGLLATRAGAVDHPDQRRAHQRPTPSWGGIAIFAGFWLDVGIFCWPPTPTVVALFIASLGLLAVSLIDDVRGLSPLLRLGVHFLIAAGLWVFGGVRVLSIGVPFVAGGTYEVSLGLLSFPITVFWIGLVINALNWSDGMDGLAAGTGAVASVALAVLAVSLQAPLLACMGLALAGACLGFLCFNVKPARIFMGDAGAMFLGLKLACIAVLGTNESPAPAAACVPIFALGVPLYDVLTTMIRRVRAGRPVHHADREHVHHRLLDRGWREDAVVMSLWCITGLLSVLALVLFR